MCQCTTEQWRPIPDHEGYYEASTCGRVRSLNRVVTDRRGRTLRLRGQQLGWNFDHTTGYYRVGLSKNGVGRLRHIHSLVLETFVGPRPPGMEACHGPDGQLDNHLTNLEWNTPSSNSLDMRRDGTDYNLNKTVCPLDHLLIKPNLTPCKLPARQCLACARARSTVRYAWVKKGLVLDLRAEADARYTRIMST
jgi:NUMOD4 motif